MAAAVDSMGAARQRDAVFLSVFPKTNFTTPTPEATPDIGTLASPGQSFGGFNVSNSSAEDVIKFNRAWSNATRYLSLQPGLDSKPLLVDKETVGAFSLLLARGASRKDLQSWYTNEISLHFRNFGLPELQAWQQPIPASATSDFVRDTVHVLRGVEDLYTKSINGLIAQRGDIELFKNSIIFKTQIQENLHTLVVHSLPRQRLQATLADVFFEHLNSSLQRHSNPEKCNKGVDCHCTLNLQGVPLDGLRQVGLGGLLAERAFAHALHKFLGGPAIERRCFQVDWNGHSSVVPKLRAWISQRLCPVVEGAIAALNGNPLLKFTDHDRQQLVSMATTNLGRLRTRSLFDYVKTWPASKGAIMDIWEYLNHTGQNDKAYVCESFTNQVQQRLLHAGASTSEILSIYVNVIHAFRMLDSRGVLLEKVAIPIRNYLRIRDDTVSIIAASFLADIDENGNVTADVNKVCPDITTEVSSSTLEASRDTKMLNWDDMEWMPDPIDAGPDYKASKADDVVAYVLGLFEQEEFIKEVTTVLAQHLLNATDHEYVKETRLVELFKSRLDATKLQAAEVMLKDMRDSVHFGRRINPLANYNAAAAEPTPREIQASIPEDGITAAALYRMYHTRMKRSHFFAALNTVAKKRNDLFFAKRTRIRGDSGGPSNDQPKEGQTKFKAQILSSFFWPQLRSNEFNMPQSLEPLQRQFEQRFNALGSQRKLHFQPSLAHVTVRLDLEDRTVEEANVPGWRASVINAFASERAAPKDVPEEYDDDIGLTSEHLVGMLSMEEDLVQDALNFWINKSVLYHRSDGTYAVRERLDTPIDTMQAPVQPPPVETISAVMSQDAMLKESAPMFETFIANMLRNQGAKQVGGMMGITNLLKMVLPSFTYGDEEVLWLLGEMEGRGEVKQEGETWKVV